MTPSEKRPSILRGLADKFLRRGAERTLFLCGGPDCCSPEKANAAYETAKRRIDELGLNKHGRRATCVKTGCLGVCGEGPIAVVYPEKIWYNNMSGEPLAKVIETHLGEGRPLEGYAFEPPPDAKPPRG